jgi:TRAP-type mannitol/chloroaromatic compound transport system permease small subunit
MVKPKRPGIMSSAHADQLVMEEETAPESSVEADGEKPVDTSADSAALAVFEKIHPVGFVAAGALVAAVIGHVAFDTDRIVGSMAWWQWLALGAVMVLSVRPKTLNGLRLGIESLSVITLRVAWISAWLVFIVQFITVVTRYLNPLFEQDILIGQIASSATWFFGIIALLGLNHGVKQGVNPRIDFWWADWSDRKKAWLDFVMHTFFFLPFLYAANLILRQYAATSLGQRRGDGVWPNSWRVWDSWESAQDADELPLGPLKALIFVGFVMFALQIAAEIIKTGFVLMGNSEYGDIGDSNEMQRIE